MRSRTAPSDRRHQWRRSTARAAVLGAIATMAVASVASAVPPYEPDESSECHPYGTGIDDCGFYPDPPADGDTPNQDNSDDPTNDCSSANYGFDVIKLTGGGVSFGDGSFVGGAPLWPGSVSWSVPDCDYYSARLVGTLHLNGVSGKFGRMHVSYWWNGELLETHHSSALHATDNGHEERSVVMSPFIGTNVDEVHVCTEISDDGDDFDQVDCKTRYLG